MKIALGCDHGGFELKEDLKIFLKELGYEVVDYGTHSTETVSYTHLTLPTIYSV